MYSRKDIRTKMGTPVHAGSILMAQPFWQDEKYRRSVIIILEHNASGSKGIILNKQSTLIVSDALLDMEISLPLYYGGPFVPQVISFMHNYAEVPEAFNLGNGLFLDGNYEFFQDMLDQKKINLRRIKFYSGCVLWTAGQLENEIQENKWWTSKITAQEFFKASADELWTYELLNNGHLYGLLNEFPDPCMS